MRKGDWTAIIPLQCFAVSAKRYCLFNDGADGAPVIRKASAHGLGHLLPPYEDPDKEKAAKRIREIKVDLWHEILWTRIVMAVDRPDGGLALDLESDDGLTTPAASRYAARSSRLVQSRQQQAAVSATGQAVQFLALIPSAKNGSLSLSIFRCSRMD